MSEYAICRESSTPNQGFPRVMERECTITPAQAALGAMTEEEMDAVVCLRAGLDYLRRPFLEDTADGYGSWSAEILQLGKSGHGKTRAEALHALAEQVMEEGSHD